MTNQEFSALRAHQRLTHRHPKGLYQGRRSVKSRAKGVGQILMDSSIRSEVSLERVFVTRK